MTWHHLRHLQWALGLMSTTPPRPTDGMPVCRRCGAQTNGSEGKRHLPDEGNLERYTNWLDAQSRIDRIDRSREMFVK